MTFASWLGRKAMRPFSKALPPLGETERAALEAGTVGFEGQLFGALSSQRGIRGAQRQPEYVGVHRAPSSVMGGRKQAKQPARKPWSPILVATFQQVNLSTVWSVRRR